MFDIGKEYKRKEDIHNLYGGQSQGGISTPKNHPFIFIFTSDAGEQHSNMDIKMNIVMMGYFGTQAKVKLVI